MDKRNGLEAAKKLVRRRGERVAPTVDPIVPEVRTPIKWKPTGTHIPPLFRQEAFVLVVWNFGVPFAEIEGFHEWLATNEIDLDGLCQQATGDQVRYLGTYLHLDTGAPRYQTFWGLKADDDISGTDAAEKALTSALKPSSTLCDLVSTLRSYWVRDANATDLRYGQARHYINLDKLPIDSCFWGVTRLATAVKPIP